MYYLEIPNEWLNKSLVFFISFLTLRICKSQNYCVPLQWDRSLHQGPHIRIRFAGSNVNKMLKGQINLQGSIFICTFASEIKNNII